MAAPISFPELAGTIRKLPPSCGLTRIVAVDGPGGSGKTTFAGRLARELGAQVIHSDDFPVPWDESPATWFKLVDKQVLGPLTAGEPGRYQRYDWVRGRFEDWMDVPVAPILLLEGVSTARRTAPVAFAIWVEAPRELRLARVLARDGAQLAPQWQDWMRAEDEWFAADGTRAHADLLLDGAAIPGEFVRIR